MRPHQVMVTVTVTAIVPEPLLDPPPAPWLTFTSTLPIVDPGQRLG